MLLPDYLRPGLRVVITGVAAGGEWGSPRQPGRSRRGRDGRRRYYAGRGNAFWRLLHESGLVPEPLTPADDERLPDYGVGLTDLAKTVTPEPGGGGVSVHYDVRALDAKAARAAPDAVAFVSKAAAHAYAQGAGRARPKHYGETPWPVGGRPAFSPAGYAFVGGGTPTAARPVRREQRHAPTAANRAVARPGRLPRHAVTGAR